MKGCAISCTVSPFVTVIVQSVRSRSEKDRADLGACDLSCY